MDMSRMQAGSGDVDCNSILLRSAAYTDAFCFPSLTCAIQGQWLIKPQKSSNRIGRPRDFEKCCGLLGRFRIGSAE